MTRYNQAAVRRTNIRLRNARKLLAEAKDILSNVIGLEDDDTGAEGESLTAANVADKIEAFLEGKP